MDVIVGKNRIDMRLAVVLYRILANSYRDSPEYKAAKDAITYDKDTISALW